MCPTLFTCVWFFFYKIFCILDWVLRLDQRGYKICEILRQIVSGCSNIGNNWSMVSFSGSSWTLTQPWNFPGHVPVGYMGNACAEKLLIFHKTYWVFSLFSLLDLYFVTWLLSNISAHFSKYTVILVQHLSSHPASGWQFYNYDNVSAISLHF